MRTPCAGPLGDQYAHPVPSDSCRQIPAPAADPAAWPARPVGLTVPFVIDSPVRANFPCVTCITLVSGPYFVLWVTIRLVSLLLHFLQCGSWAVGDSCPVAGPMKSQGPHDTGPKPQPKVTASRWEGQLGTHVPTHPTPLDPVRHFSSRGVPLLMMNVAVAGLAGCSTAASQDLSAHGLHPRAHHQGFWGRLSSCATATAPASSLGVAREAPVAGQQSPQAHRCWEPGFSGHVGCPARGRCWGWRGVLGTAGTCPHVPAKVLPGGCA